MSREEQIIKSRLKKLEDLRGHGYIPYAHKFDKKDYCKDIQEKYKKLKKEQETKDKVKIAGRIMTIRDMGKINFITLRDGTDKIQLVLRKGATPSKEIEFFKKYLDAGDFIGIEGTIFKTKRGEVSILVQKVTLLTKSIKPLPEKFHGIKDEDEKLRKRYLDLAMNPETKELFMKRYKFWKAMREFLEKKGFIEVETPVLENTTGGADAKPFVTHHNALDMDVYLRISTGELWQKRLMVGGFEKTFEIGRQFRNEGMSHEHLQDYTQMEFYWGYANYEDGMKLVEDLYKYVTKETLGTLKFKSHGFNIDFSKPWKKIDYVSEVKKHTGIDFFKSSLKDIEKKLKELKIQFEPGLDKERLIDLLWKHCRKSIAGPAFLINHPVEISPLAKRSEKDPRLVERFIVIFAGSEVGNGYSELNDPIDQEKRFKRQAQLREAGDEEAQMNDEEFVEALKYGMPPTCGFGTSERFFAYLMDKPARECQIFPLMKPEKAINEKTKKIAK